MDIFPVDNVLNTGTCNPDCQALLVGCRSPVLVRVFGVDIGLGGDHSQIAEGTAAVTAYKAVPICR